MARITSPNPVIICISPQFVAEQWQMFMLNAHVAHRFGAHIHIYITSILESFFEFMKEYEKYGYITIDYWLRMKFTESVTPYYEPNGNTEFRNQAGAYTDCLLQYKEAAQYIAFFDLDDILFPLEHSNYLKEFNAEFHVQNEISSIYYLRKQHEFVKATKLSEFSFYDVLGSLRTSTNLHNGAIVVNPSLYNSTGIHGSQHETSKKRRTIDESTIIHMKWPLERDHVDNITKLLKADFSPFSGKIRPKDIIQIEKDIWRMRSLPQIAIISRSLPKSDFFFPFIFKCYNDVFSSGSNEIDANSKNCPNIESCLFPQKDEYRCVHSDAEYFSSYHMKPFTFHYANNSFWSYDIGCYQ